LVWGNPDLKTEVSIGGEAGFTFNTPITFGARDASIFSLKGALFSIR